MDWFWRLPPRTSDALNAFLQTLGYQRVMRRAPRSAIVIARVGSRFRAIHERLRCLRLLV
jgi:hypothetical protein